MLRPGCLKRQAAREPDTNQTKRLHDLVGVETAGDCGAALHRNIARVEQESGLRMKPGGRMTAIRRNVGAASACPRLTAGENALTCTA